MPLVSGFRAYPPRAEIYRHPFTGAVIATPVLDLSSVRGPQGYADRSGTGANGAPVGAPTNARGVFDEAIKFGGVRDGLNCGSNASLDIGGDISITLWINPYAAPAPGAYLILMSKSQAPATGWAFFTTPTNGLFAYIYPTASFFSGGTSLPLRRFAYAAFVIKSNIGRLFVDGLQDARGNMPSTDDPTRSLTIGYRDVAPAYYFDGSMEIPQLWNGALSPEQIYRQYLQAKDVPIYYDTFESYAVTPVAKAAGSMCGPFMVQTGASAVRVTATGQKYAASSGGVSVNYRSQTEAPAYGTIEFDLYLTGNGAILGFFSNSYGYGGGGYGTLNGYELLLAPAICQLNRLTAGGVAIINQFAGIPVGAWYSFRIVRRVGGQFSVYIKSGATWPDWTLMAPTAGTMPSTDNTYTSGIFTTFTGNADGGIANIRQSRVCERPASFPWEFSTGTYAGVVSGSTVWMRCLTAGVTYLPKDLDWQTMTFKLYKGADANVTDLLFVASEIGGSTFANQNGYVLRIAADESVQLVRTTGGIEAAPTAQTAAGYVAITTEYEFKITHNGTTNAYEFYIRGGAYATWTLMFAATLGIHTSSNFTIWDLDASDRATAPAFYADLR